MYNDQGCQVLGKTTAKSLPVVSFSGKRESKEALEGDVVCN